MNTSYRTGVTPGPTGSTATATPAQNVFAPMTAATQAINTATNSVAHAGTVNTPFSLETLDWPLIIIIVLALIILYAIL